MFECENNGNDYTLGSFTVAAAWSDQLGQCQQAVLNPPVCGLMAGQPCCNGNICTGSNLGCDQSSTCVACPPPAPVTTLVAQREDRVGSNCFGDTNHSQMVGSASCGAGLTRAFLKTTSVDVSADASCTAHWVTNNPTDCRAQVDYHVPTDCGKHVDCVTQVFATSGALPASAVRARLTIADGHTLNSDHHYTIGGPCDDGFHHPASPPTPAVISGDPGETCAANWSNPGNPNDCTAVVTYHLGDLTKQINCDTQVVQTANSNVVAAGCP